MTSSFVVFPDKTYIRTAEAEVWEDETNEIVNETTNEPDILPSTKCYSVSKMMELLEENGLLEDCRV